MYLLQSGKVGVVDRDKNTIAHIFRRWDEFGLLDGLETDIKLKVCVACEIVAHMLLAEGKMCDMHFKMTGNIIDEDDDQRIDTIIFPIIRRVISKYNEAYKYVPEIVGMTKWECKTVLWRSIKRGDERAMVYCYEKLLPKWSDWHKDREHNTYQEFKMHAYKKQADRVFKSNGHILSYEDFAPMDWEAEFTAALANRIEKDLREREK